MQCNPDVFMSCPQEIQALCGLMLLAQGFWLPRSLITHLSRGKVLIPQLIRSSFLVPQLP